MADEKPIVKPTEAKPVETASAPAPVNAQPPAKAPDPAESADHEFWNAIKEWVRREVHLSQAGTHMDDRREMNP